MIVEYGYIVRVENKHGNFWLGQRVYRSHESAVTAKHNLTDTKQYRRVYILRATKNQLEQALSVVD